MLGLATSTLRGPAMPPPPIPVSPIRAASAVDARRCIDVLTRAFENDPPGAAFSLGTAGYWEGFAGAALWLPPEGSPDGR
jgi:hypothetical protein